MNNKQIVQNICALARDHGGAAGAGRHGWRWLEQPPQRSLTVRLLADALRKAGQQVRTPRQTAGGRWRVWFRPAFRSASCGLTLGLQLLQENMFRKVSRKPDLLVIDDYKQAPDAYTQLVEHETGTARVEREGW